MQNTKQKSGTKQKLTIAAIFGAMGPGLLAALSGNDAGGIATYSSAGASYGYKMLWMLPVMTVLLIVTQETAARCGCVTGKGLASLIRDNRVNHVCAADYTEGSEIDRLVKLIIDKIAVDFELQQLEIPR